MRLGRVTAAGRSLPYQICQSVKIAITVEGIITGYRRLAGIAEGGVCIAISVWKNICSVGSAGSAGIPDANAASMCPWAISRGQSISVPDGYCTGSGDEAQGGIQVRTVVPLISCAGIRHSIGAENPIPEEVNDTKIAVRVPVMNKVQFLLAPEPRKPLKARSFYVILPVEKDVRVERRRTCD